MSFVKFILGSKVERAKKTRRSQREGYAYHEAGHAVIGWALGNRIKRVSIDKERDGWLRKHSGILGYTGFAWGALSLIDCLAVLWAGSLAEKGYWGRELFHITWNSFGDRREIGKLLTDWPELDHDFILEESKGRAELYVWKLWPIIEELAAELLARKTLTGKDAHSIIKQAAVGAEMQRYREKVFVA